MSITVAPTMTVAGQPVSGDLAAVDSLRLTWGRSGVLEQPTPATAALTVRDTSRGAVFARRADLIGQPVVLGWAGSDGSTGINFRGRITDAQVRPRRRGGFSVALAASSLEVDLAAYRVPEGIVWPEETFAARRDRIVGLLPAGLLPGGATLPDRLDLGLPDLAAPDVNLATLPAAQVDAGGQDSLALLRELYASTSPLPMVYDPAAQRITFATRRRFAYSVAGLTMSAMLTPSAGHGGRYVAASLSGRHLDAQRTAYAGALSQALDSLITRIDVQYLERTAAYEQQSYEAATTGMAALEAVYGRRVLTVTSIHALRANAAQLGDALYSDVVSREARTPRLAAVGYSSDREPFADAAHAALLLAGAESGVTLFLGGSWLPRLGQRPLVGILGATVTYAGGDWSVDFVPAPVFLDPTPNTWAPVTAAASAIDTTVTLADIDPSVTVGDLGFIDVGAGFDTITVNPYKGNPL